MRLVHLTRVHTGIGLYSLTHARSLIKLAITFTVLYIIRTILLALPGIAISIPNIPITFIMIVNLVLGVLMIAVMLRFGREITPTLRDTSIPSPVTGVIANLVYLAAIGIAYISFYPLVDGVLPNYIWGYSLVLFMIAVFPIGRISMSFYRSIDKLTDLISKRMVKPRVRTEEKPERCPFCGSALEPNATFCSNCGAKIR